MKSKVNKDSAITLVALVITIIVLLILAGITLNLTLGENGLQQRALQAKEKSQKAEATEKINLIVSESYLQSYREVKLEPTLQYIADTFASNNEVEYVAKSSQKIAADKIILEPTDEKIYVKLLEYPYEFEINKNFKIASIDGEIINDNSTNSEEYQQILETLNQLKEENQQLKEDNEKIQLDYSNLQKEYENLKNTKRQVGIYMGWKKATGWNDNGLFDGIEVDSAVSTLESGKITIKESGRYLISIFSKNTNGGGAPKFQLLKNNVCIKECNNNSTENNMVRASIELDLNVGDVLFAKQYGGGTSPTTWITTFYKLAD